MDGWQTKWWPHWQFSFFLAVAEVNALNTQGRARGEVAESVLGFLKLMAIQMMENKLDDDGNIITEFEHSRTHAISIMEGHNLETRPNFMTRIWMHSSWKKSTQEYQKSICICGNRCRTHCSCNKGQTMCQKCHVIHCMEL